MTEHSWHLTGPWYRRESIGGGLGGRGTAPILQKYAATDFANRIVREPQESLKFVSEDFVTRLTSDPNRIITPALRGPYREPLKLFLDLHSRFYVVVCALHCDVAGFPRVNRDQVCEAGFVIRRKVTQAPTQARKQLAALIAERNQIKQQVLKTQRKEKRAELGKSSLGELLGAQAQQLADQFHNAKLLKLKQQFDENTEQLHVLVEEAQISDQLQGWKPASLAGVGNWAEIDESPQQLTEQVYPLYPIMEDPTIKDHSAHGQTLWFGLVPTSSADTTADGGVKFDDETPYHIRCFVRRHKAECPKKTHESDCSGALVWSEPTESYYLASAYDLDGASHRPINLTMPNLDKLKQQADLGPPGRGVSAKVISPPNSTPVFSTKNMDLPVAGDPPTRESQQFCFYFSLLFFLVAMFLFRLILPIFMLLFQLWFLLKLKLCIPPSFEMSVDLQLELSAEFNLTFEVDVDFAAEMAVTLATAGPDLEAQFDAGLELEIGGVTFSQANANKAELKALIARMIAEETGVSSEEGTEEKAMNLEMAKGLEAMSLDDLADAYISLKTEYIDPQHEELAGQLPTPENGLEYFSKEFAT